MIRIISKRVNGVIRIQGVKGSSGMLKKLNNRSRLPVIHFTVEKDK